MAGNLDKLLLKGGLRLKPVWKSSMACGEAELFKRFLASDLTESAETVLPNDQQALFTFETTKSAISKPMIVQLAAVEEIGKPKYKPAEGTAGGNAGEDEEREDSKYLTGVEKESKSERGVKMLKLSFVHGSTTFSGIEMERLPEFTLEIEKNVKVLLKSPFEVRRSIALLWKSNCELLRSLDQLRKL